MSAADLRYIRRIPTLEEFRVLRVDAGWRVPPDDDISTALSNTLFGVCVETTDDAVVGMGRIVGDGGIQFFITDVIVQKTWQQQGIGTAIMLLLIEYIAKWHRLQHLSAYSQLTVENRFTKSMVLSYGLIL